MSLKRTLLLLAAVMALLSPAALLLKNQNPWNCFNYTVDESFFAQAASNWSEGKGYRLAEGRPFDPLITVGVPMAWGSAILKSATGDEIANSGRLFVYITFVLTLLALGRTAFRVDRQWLTVPLVIGIFAYGLSKVSFGGYFVFGFLGEMPGILLGCLAYRAMDEKKFLRAGLLAVGVFLMKPTFLFFLPAIGIAALLHSRKAALGAGVGFAAGLSVMFHGISRARSESIHEYLQVFFDESVRIAGTANGGSLLDLYPRADSIPAIFSLAFLGYGANALIRHRRARPSVNTAFLLFIFSAGYYLTAEIRPVEKQWNAIFVLALAGYSVPWAVSLADRFAALASREFTRAIVLAVLLTWVFSVGSLAHHHYKNTPENACPSKEQTTINRKLRALADMGEVTPENLGVLMPTINYDMSLYGIGWNPRYSRKWGDIVPKDARWIYGETRALFPAPSGCASYWEGSTFSILHCDREKTLPVKSKRFPESRSRN